VYLFCLENNELHVKPYITINDVQFIQRAPSNIIRNILFSLKLGV